MSIGEAQTPQSGVDPSASGVRRHDAGSTGEKAAAAAATSLPTWRAASRKSGFIKFTISPTAALRVCSPLATLFMACGGK